jgi:transcriptional regulator GlxA family with amidase domain
MRVEAARRQIEGTERGLKQVASAAGFGSVDVMRRAFVQRRDHPLVIASSPSIRRAADGSATASH